MKPDGGGILIGSLPQRPLKKAMAGEGLLSQILIDKYVDHLPLHRQMQRFERAGVKIPYATLSGWVSETCNLITPLYEALKNEVLKTNYLHADEKPIRVLDKDKPGASHKGYYWVYQNSIDKIILFDYQEGRVREGPMKMLEHFAQEEIKTRRQEQSKPVSDPATVVTKKRKLNLKRPNNNW